MPLDHAPGADTPNRAAAMTRRDLTMLIEAGAGTGKTSILAGRVAMLLAGGLPPGSIAAISYTEFAASELLERIGTFVDALIEGRPPPDLLPALPDGQVSPDELANLRGARGQLDALSCMTIHGFCRTLLTPYPVEAGIDPGAAVLDQPQADLLFEDVSKAWLRQRLSGPRNPDDVFLSLYLADAYETQRVLDCCVKHMRSNCGMQVTAAPPLTEEAADLCRAVQAFRAFITTECVDCLPPKIAAIIADMESSLASMPMGGEQHLLPWAVTLPIPEDCLAKTTGRFNADRTVTPKTAWKAAGGGRMPVAATDRLQAISVGLYNTLRDTHDAVRQAAAARALHFAGLEAQDVLACYADAKRRTAALDFDDLIESTRRLLASRPEVREALAAKTGALLVDEFQDTDQRQMEIFWRLCGDSAGNPEAPWHTWRLLPGKLFLVGDPKQSIYRFRGGDLAAYQRAADLVSADPQGSVVTITRNFRSRRNILDTVNGWFGSVFTGQNGQAGFAPLVTDVEDLLSTPGVAWLAFSDDHKAHPSTRDAEAELVAELCRRLIGSFLVRGPRGTLRTCEPGDIALLTPGATELWRYERALEDQGISVAAQAGKGFFRRQEVQDLIALTRVLADSRDRLALGALLRGPLVGLPDNELLDAVEAVSLGQEGEPRLDLRMDASLLKHGVLRDVVERLQSLTKMRRRMPPHLLLARAVDELRVRPTLRQRGGRIAERALANVDLFLEMSRTFDLRGVKAFSDSVRAQWEEAGRSMDARPDMDRRSVNLMTMHAAKGLEWPVVILVNTAGKIHSPVDVGTDRKGGIFHVKCWGRHPDGCEASLEEEDRQRKLERARLWWVATTRARDLLLMPDPAQRLSPPAWISAATLSLDAVPPLEHTSWEGAAAAESEPPVNVQDAAVFADEGGRIRASIPVIRRVTPSLHEAGEADAPVHADDGSEGAATVRGAGRARGLILHKLLEEVLVGMLADDLASLTARASRLLTTLGTPAEVAPEPAEMAAAIIRGLSLSEIAAVRSSLRPEWPIASSSRSADGVEEIIVGIADAVATVADGTAALAVDWKSDVDPRDAAVAKYAGQLRNYLAATGIPSGLLVFLTSGLAVRVECPCFKTHR